ncbi:hypothetical protein [Streptomyces sp. NPDC049040]|uniref:hypothetical protein n=1 Tax=Streptomyces sp. NPDC049040 TaxID=3365593 RepID=UPI003722B4CB
MASLSLTDHDRPRTGGLPLLEPPDLDGALVTFDALHSVKANVTWLVETKNAHYIAMIKRNQATAYRQLAGLPWPEQSATSPNEPSHSWASPTSLTLRALDQALTQEERTSR